MSTEEFISEPITPLGGFDTAAMAQGLPGLPRGFTWREQEYTVVSPLESWKVSATEGGRPGAERYLRRHYSRLQMNDGTTWTVYFTRQAARGARLNARRAAAADTPAESKPPRTATTRWFLYSRSPARDDPPRTGAADRTSSAAENRADTGRGSGPNG